MITPNKAMLLLSKLSVRNADDESRWTRTGFFIQKDFVESTRKVNVTLNVTKHDP